MTAEIAVIRAALDFANRAAGEGLSIDGLAPEDFLMDYCIATGFEDFESLADHVLATLNENKPAT